jgi:hypothetical protein
MSNKRKPRRDLDIDIDRQLSPWSRRRVLSWSLFTLAVLMAGQHLLAHAGWRPVPITMAKQDIFLGYPAALVLGILAAITMDPHPRL